MTTRAEKKRLYNTRWRKLRLLHLKAHPLCVMCTQDGRIAPATEVDHIIKHDGDRTLFFDKRNLQSLCADHHRGYKAKLERSGKDTACDAYGNPLNPPEHWR